MKDRFITRRNFVKFGLGATAFSFVDSSLPSLSFSSESTKKLPRWRGFNLLEKFNGSNRPFREDDFKNISDLGFNFVRLPMDYRAWIVGNDRRKFNEKTLKEIDQAIELGRRYGIHVHLNFHRAPGYTVANPPESPLVWRDAETLDVCRLHWQTFARRYKDVPRECLSFNLFNEPAGCTEEEYYKVVSTLIEAIREESPERLIFCDGLDWGTKPCPSLKKFGVWQSTRGYAPMEISHYGASWVDSKNFPYPSWPSVSFNGLLPAPDKQGIDADARKPFLIEGEIPAGSTLRFRLNVVSNRAEIVVNIDDKEAFRRKFVPGAGKGEWKESIFSKQYNIYQNVYDLDLEVKIPDDARKITIQTVDGDWASLSEIGLSVASNKEIVASGALDWNAKKQTVVQFVQDDDGARLIGIMKDRAWLKENCMKPWLEAEKSGINVMVGEFGAHNQTPIDVARRWFEDMLKNWKEAGWGWAMWNFRGSFGVADSGRADVDYEDWRGLKLDRKTLELLQKY